MAEEPDVGKWPSLVPEIYYDLIARVPAGTIIFLALVLIGGRYSLDQLKGENLGSATLVLALVLLFGYALGILITPLGSVFHRQYRETVWRQSLEEQDYATLIQSLNSDFELQLPKNESGTVDLNKFHRREYDRLDRFMHDFLKGSDPQAKVILPKMRAEASLCDHLFVAFGCTALIGIYSIYVRRLEPREYLGMGIIILIGLGLAAWGARHRNKRLIHRQFSFLTLTIGNGGGMAANNRMNPAAGARPSR